MWISVKDKEVVLPSLSKVILVTDGYRPQLITVEKFLETVDTPYNTWTYWMEIPKTEELIPVNEEKLDKLADEYANNNFSYNIGINISKQSFKAGYRKALENK